jgi:hypothetical protein
MKDDSLINRLESRIVDLENAFQDNVNLRLLRMESHIVNLLTDCKILNRKMSDIDNLEATITIHWPKE